MKKFYAALKEFYGNMRNSLLLLCYIEDFSMLLRATNLIMISSIAILLTTQTIMSGLLPTLPFILGATAISLAVAVAIFIGVFIADFFSTASVCHRDGALLSGMRALTPDLFRDLASSIVLTLKERELIIRNIDRLAETITRDSNSKALLIIFTRFCNKYNAQDLIIMLKNSPRYRPFNQDKMLTNIEESSQILYCNKDRLVSDATGEVHSKLEQLISTLNKITTAEEEENDIAKLCKSALLLTHPDRFNSVLKRAREATPPPSQEEDLAITTCAEAMPALVRTLNSLKDK
jgi:hypothetical protein